MMKSELSENKDTAKLMGLLLTDGGVSKVSGRWRFHFTSNSDVLINEFKNLVKRLYGYSLTSERRFGATSVRVWMRNSLAEELHKLTPSYRKLAYDKLNGEYPNVVIPEFIKRDRNLARLFLKYAFTGDGCISFSAGKAKYGFKFDRVVAIFCEHPRLRMQYYLLLKELGYAPKISKHCVYMRRKKNLEKFNKEIGFVDGVEIGGNGQWRGITKSALLDFCANSYSLRPSALGKTKKEIYDNLSFLVRETPRSSLGQDEV